jgi:hypothetical protein
MAWLLGAAGSTILAMVTGVAEGVGGILLGEGGGETRESSSPTAIPTGDPIKITKITTVPRSIDGTWVHPESLDDQAVAKINREIEEFEKSTYEIMRSHGAVETGTSSVELELEGNRPTPVRITDIAIDARCREPLTGTLFYNPPQGEAETVQIGYDLDRDTVFAQKSTMVEGEPFPRLIGNYFAEQKYTLKQGEQVTFRLTALSRRQYCEYAFELHYIADGKPGSRRVDDGGKPFRVSALVGKDGIPDCAVYQRHFTSTERVWSKASRAQCWEEA